jgi:hypothetical protein
MRERDVPDFLQWLRERQMLRRAGQKTQRGVTIVTVVLLLGMLAISYLLAQGAPEEGGGRGIGIGITAYLLFAASGMVGSGFGFLFGLPRARFADQFAPTRTGTTNSSANPAGSGTGSAGASTAAAGSGTAVAQPSAATHYVANSNLIKVSDWLTTIIIGLGLVNLGRAIPALRSLAVALKAPLGGAPYAGAVGLSILIVSFLSGFLLMYLWTSIRVRELLEDAESQFESSPDVTKKTVGQAKADFGTTSLKLGLPSDAPDDAVIETQSPPAGTPLPHGGIVRVTLQP